jgi:hypothetical protein
MLTFWIPNSSLILLGSAHGALVRCILHIILSPSIYLSNQIVKYYTETAINKNFVDPLLDIRRDWNWENDFWLDLSNAYLWNTDATKNILEKSLPFPIFVATGYDARNSNAFIPIENTLLYSGVPVDPRKLNENSTFGGGFVQVSYLKKFLYFTIVI